MGRNTDSLIREHKIDRARVVSIPRGVDLSKFDPEVLRPDRVEALRTVWRIAPNEPRLVLLLAGRLTRWKGQAFMLRALARRKAEAGRDDVLLVLAGDDQGRQGYLDELDSLVAEHDLAAAVRLVGHVEDMPAAYLVADAALAPSLDPEAFGRTAVEPQAMGRPVLAADHGAVRETVADGTTGFRVAPGDEGAWIAALDRLVDLGGEGRAAMGAAGLARARVLYSLQRMTDLTLDAYCRVLEGRDR